MSYTGRQSKPKIVALYNESPHWPESDKAWTARMVQVLTDSLSEKGLTYQPLKIYDNLESLDQFDPREWLVWNWAEEINGQPWSDSVVAAELTRRGFAYTGSPAETLSFSVHRMKVKERLQACGLPTLEARVFTDPAQAEEWKIYPAIVKGANQHGSFGMDGNSIVHSPTQLARRIAHMRETLNDDSLVEQFLDSREFHVAVFGNGKPEAFPPAEYDYSVFTDMHDRLYTYDWKYNEHSRGFTALKIVSPSPVDNPQLREQLEAVAVGAYRALGLSDYGRIDLRLLGNEPQVLDVNPNPDLDTTSALMASAHAKGMTYADVVELIIHHASARMPR
jgi:D-alanine-D-alanine ligase